MVRERREDRADALAGAAWRAEHMPHLAALIERDGRGWLMWSVTGWALATWVKLTLVLAAGVAARLARPRQHPARSGFLRVPRGRRGPLPSASSPGNGPTTPASPAGGGRQ